MDADTILLHFFEEVAHACEYKWWLAFSDCWLSLGRPGSLRVSIHMFMIGPIRKTRCWDQHCGPPQDDFATNAYVLPRVFPNNMTIRLSTFTTRNFQKTIPTTTESSPQTWCIQEAGGSPHVVQVIPNTELYQSVTYTCLSDCVCLYWSISLSLVQKKILTCR